MVSLAFSCVAVYLFLYYPGVMYSHSVISKRWKITKIYFYFSNNYHQIVTQKKK